MAPYHKLIPFILCIFLPLVGFGQKETNTPNKEAYQNVINDLLVGEAQVFRQNMGQWASNILYQSSGSNAIASFYSDKVAFTLRKNVRSDSTHIFDPTTAKASFLTWNMLFSGSNSTSITPHSKISRNIHYFGPSSPNGKSIQDYERIEYHDIYPQIDLTFYSAKTGALKYDYILKPGGSINDIQMEYEGVKGINLLPDGKLQVQTEWGNYTEDKPYSFQTINGVEQEVDVKYVVCDGVVGFEIQGDYDPNYALVIDPIYLDWSTYFYGSKVSATSSQWTWILDIDIDDDDYVYITGMTSEAYPGTIGAYDTAISGFYDAFICKIKPKGDSIEYFSYLGGSSYDYGMNLTVNQLQQPVISGLTWGGNFPTTTGAFDTKGRSSGSFYQGFVTKFSAKGDSLVFSTYLSAKSGTGYDWIRSMTINDAGDVFVVGNTQSDDFPTTTGCFQSSFGGLEAGGNFYTRGDAFMTCLKSDGGSLIFSTFIGGSKNESAYDIYLDENEEIYVVGTTSSGNFPITAGAGVFNTFIKGTYDAFVMKFKKNGNQLIFSKIMGGTGEDIFEGIYSNKRGEPFIAGYTNSGNFPTTSNAFQKSNAGAYDYMIVKMISSGTNIRWSTYLGGSGNEHYYNSPFFSTIKITANVKDEAIISGISQSTNFPVTSDAIQPNNRSTNSWKQNLTIAKLSYGGDKLMYGTYFGGSYWEWPGAVKSKRVGCVTYILAAGITGSSDYPVTKGVYRDTMRQKGSFNSGFVSKFRDTLFTEAISLGFGDTLLKCDVVSDILDAQNRGAKFLWSDGTTSQYMFPDKPGKVWVQATYGCDTVRDTIEVVLEFSPTVPILNNDSTYCNTFPSLVLDAKNDTIRRSYVWSTGATTQKISVNTPGKYYVDIVTPNCGTKTDTINFKLLKTPQVDLGKDQIKCDSVRLTLDAKNSGNEVKYLWNTKDTTQTMLAKDTGKYSVKVSNVCGADSGFIHLSKFVQPKAILPADSVFCNSVFIVFNGGQGLNGETYQWTTLDGLTEHATATAIVWNKPEDLRLIVKNKCGISSDSVYISQLLTPKAGIRDTIWACDMLDNTVQIGKTNNAEKYIWSTGESTNNLKITTPGRYVGNIENKCGKDSSIWNAYLNFTPAVKLPNDSTYCGTINVPLNVKRQDPDMKYLWQDGSLSPNYTINQKGSYWVKLHNRCGLAIDTVKYDLLQKPVVAFGLDRVFCGGVKPFKLTAGQIDNKETYLWSDGSVGNEMQVSSEGKHWVLINNYCGKATDTIGVRISPYPIVDLGPDTVLCGNFTLKLDAGNPGLKYLWTPFGETTQTIIATEQVKYGVTVTNADGCSGKSDFEVGSGCVSHVFVPSSFTPNSDGLNDIFKPTLENYEQYSMSIYNRWGELLFETSDVNKGWNGFYKGAMVQQGIYLYSIQLITTEDGRFRNISGVLHVIR